MTTMILSKGETSVTFGTWCNPIISVEYTYAEGAEMSLSQWGYAQFDKATCPATRKWIVDCIAVTAIRDTFRLMIETMDDQVMDPNYNGLLTLVDNRHTNLTFFVFIPLKEYSESPSGERWSLKFPLFQIKKRD